MSNTTKKATTHSLERTSPFGQNFVGTCVLCGKTGLSFKDMDEECENVRGLTQDEAVLEAMEERK